MATTTKKPRAKTKTAKKPSTKKTSATKASVATKTQAPSLSDLMRLNLTSGILSLLLAALAGFLMSSASYQLFTSLLTTNELASTNETIFVPAINAVFDLQLRWAVVGILLVSAIVPLLAATRNRKMYEDSLAKKVMLWRWLEVGVVSALIVETIAMLSGIQDIMTLKLLAGFMVITGLLGWFSEKQNVAGSKVSWRHYNLSLVTGSLPWLVIAVSAVGTLIYGNVRSPWYVYALYASMLLACAGYAVNGRRQLEGQQAYQLSERNNITIGIFAKAAFALILIVGLYKY